MMTINDIVNDKTKQKLFNALLNEACRQWCCFIVDAPERADGEGFAEFFFEIFEAKFDEFKENMEDDLEDKQTVYRLKQAECTIQDECGGTDTLDMCENCHERGWYIVPEQLSLNKTDDEYERYVFPTIEQAEEMKYKIENIYNPIKKGIKRDCDYNRLLSDVSSKFEESETGIWLINKNGTGLFLKSPQYCIVSDIEQIIECDKYVAENIITPHTLAQLLYRIGRNGYRLTCIIDKIIIRQSKSKNAEENESISTNQPNQPNAVYINVPYHPNIDAQERSALMEQIIMQLIQKLNSINACNNIAYADTPANIWNKMKECKW